MTDAEHLNPGPTVLVSYALALFTGAFLLFWIQPLFAKMITPQLGGAPAAWNTCMVFFQAALAAGYAYAHALSRWLPPTRQLLAHLGVLLAGGAFLPIAVATFADLDRSTAPVGWLLLVLTASVGLPFFAVSATAPLLQGWFGQTRHPHAGDPYFLYAASNLGSVGALVAFPFALERLLTNEQQTWVWSATYAILVALACGCGLMRKYGDAPYESARGATDIPRIPSRWRLGWVFYAAIPSGLLIGVTSHITTDIAAAPFLWIAPLALYLVSFIAVFNRRPRLDLGWTLRAAPLALVILAAMMMTEAQLGMSLPAGAEVVLHLAVFLLVCLMAHGLLYQHRPPVQRLTEFYLLISLGGMLGGVGTALLAPVVFDAVYEYPLALAAACLLVPASGRAIHLRDAIGAAAIVLLVFGFDRFVPAATEPSLQKIIALAVLTPMIVIALGTRTRPLGFSLCVAAILVGSVLSTRQTDALWHGRSFFGAYRVGDTEQGLRLLYHGTTVHGAQWTDGLRHRQPTTYYAKDSPVAEIIDRHRSAIGLGHVGVVGLGVGSLACYRQGSESWNFYEIDPLVVWIATRSGFFDFLSACAPDAPIVVGDGRLSLSNERAKPFDLLIIDAFTSDAIPVHLLTREAFTGYFDRLAPDGALVLHVSNRHVDLTPIIGRLAAEMGLSGRLGHKTSDRRGFASMASDWIVLARRAETLERLRLGSQWSAMKPSGEGPLWTDDYSNIIEAIVWR